MRSKKTSFVSLFFPSIFVVCMLLFFPFRYRFEFDFDEGVNLIKAMLSLQGHSIYSDYWSDQPPVFTGLLALVFRILALNVNAGRLLVLGFSTLILVVAMDYLYRKWGVLHAILGMILIIMLPFYTTLSVSIIIGLPSIAFAMLAFMGLLRWHDSDSDYWLVFSASFLALSMMTKIWTVILAPIFFAGILVQKSGFQRRKNNLREGVRPAIIWSLGFVLVASIILLFIVRPSNILQLISPHLVASNSDSMQSLAGRGHVLSYLDDSSILFVLSALGVIYALKSRAWHTLYLVGWALAAFFLITWNAPFWYHHQLLITIPAAMLGAIAIGSALVEIITRIQTSTVRSSISLLSLVILALSFVLAYDRLPKTLVNFTFNLPNLGSIDSSDDADFEIVSLIRKYADQTHYLFTDRPMYAFRSGMRVSPGLAVITQKRYVTGQPTQEEILSILEETKPEQVIVGRFNIPAVQKYMESRNFIRVDNSPRSRHYVMRDIYENP